jgi:hypothetical protein
MRRLSFRIDERSQRSDLVSVLRCIGEIHLDLCVAGGKLRRDRELPDGGGQPPLVAEGALPTPRSIQAAMLTPGITPRCRP